MLAWKLDYIRAGQNIHRYPVWQECRFSQVALPSDNGRRGSLSLRAESVRTGTDGQVRHKLWRDTWKPDDEILMAFEEQKPGSWR